MNNTEIDPAELDQAIAVIKNNLNADGTVYNPISMTQRHLRLGYTEAKAIVAEIKKMEIFHD